MTDRPDWSAPGRPDDGSPTSGASGPGWSGGAWEPGQPSPTPTPGYGRPGVIPLRPLSVGEMLDGAVTAIRHNPRVMIGLSAIVAVLSQLVQVLITVGLLGQLDYALDDLDSSQDFADSADALAALGQVLVVVLLSALVTGAAVLVLTGILTVVVSRAVIGQRITASEAWALVRPSVWRLLGVPVVIVLGFTVAGLLAMVPLLAGAEVLTILLLVALAVGGAYAVVRLALAGAVVVLERATVLTGLRRSWELVDKAWWRTFGVLALTAIITQVVAGIFALPFTLMGGVSLTEPTDQTGFWPVLTSSVGAIVGSTITWPFAAAVTVLLYVDRRMRREGLDLELARAAGIAPDGAQS